MQKPSLPMRLWVFARSYVVAAALVFALASAFVEVYTEGTGPMPQQPADGLLIEINRVELGWDKGTRSGTVKLQVSLDDPDFNNFEVDVKSVGTFHALNDIKPGHTYYWRLVQDGKPSPVAWFTTSDYAAKF